MDKISYAIENFKNMQELIRFADQKAAAIVVVYGFIITVAYEASKPLIWSIPNQDHPYILGVLVCVLGIFLLVMILCQIFYIFNVILKPRLANNYNSNDSCLYYFEHVAAQSKSDVISCFNELDEEAMLSDIASQIYEVSNTLTKKMQAVNSAINGLTYVIILMFVFILLIKAM